MSSSVVLLAIESSCDETSAAVLHNGKILSNIIATQAIHEQFGGVVPELASRAHQQNIIPVVSEALRVANIHKKELNAIAYTQGPGLLGALLVGSSFAKALALGLGLPLLGVHHMQAHILAHFIEEPFPPFPFLCLTVSGGHTQIVLVEDYLKMKIIGETLDDAAGEAFDKAAKMLQLPYPGGPLIDKYAQTGDAQKFKFNKPEIPQLNFSFSGLKTSILYFLQDQTRKNEHFIKENLADICASIQQTIVDVLLQKLKKAADMYKISHIALAGGVAANSGLRKGLETLAVQKQWHTYIPDFQYCTDNAAMIAIAAYYQYQQKQFVELTQQPLPRWEM
ncbi:MAG: tRNA (adenosine(37)-N6)-threonylcarbamoyltransferase complex transferase subunit TsaD [Cytophagales bacterium]|nr:MAG: tRNA (adenosine(37)-N6)-threonylcarbamoyltransferase complex transferase subunit TsaD [Cytophagales bacterium]